MLDCKRTLSSISVNNLLISTKNNERQWYDNFDTFMSFLNIQKNRHHNSRHGNSINKRVIDNADKLGSAKLYEMVLIVISLILQLFNLEKTIFRKQSA